MDTRKRGRYDGGSGFNVNGGPKKCRQDMESSGVGSKSKPCTKFFSTSGCPFGESCHFLHYVPGGYHAVAQMMNLPTPVPPVRNMPAPPPVPNGSGPNAVKNRMCAKFVNGEGCKFGDKCHFAHADWELGRPVAPSYDDPRGMGHGPGPMHGRMEHVPSATGFGASATAKISVDASLAGAIIGKGGVHSKQICRQTGAKLSIRDHESDPKLRNIELEGTFEQINQASAMVRELIVNLGPGGIGAKSHGSGGSGHPGSNFKTKLCDNFTKGSCTFGDRCHFAHGPAELRKTGL